MVIYDDKFYKDLGNTRAENTAREIVPIAIELVHPKSVLDVGCGIGLWLSVFSELGVEDIMGVDAKWLGKKLLSIPEERILLHDLTKPLNINRQFDLVVSLEVAEHLPEDSAEIFVNSLTSLGPVILFSAAIPFQGGTHHINEQWPNYWMELFRKKGFAVVDPIRKKIWQKQNIIRVYAQNTLMYVKQDMLEEYPLLKKEYEITSVSMISIVHPLRYLKAFSDPEPDALSLMKTISIIPVLLKNALKRRFKRFFRLFDRINKT